MIPFTPDPGEIFGRIARTKPFGKTSLLDAIQVALKQMKKARHPRKALVIISDGGDNWSRHTARETRSALLESDVQLYAMGIFDPALSSKSPAENRNGPALLDELAGQTGGRQYPVANLNDLPDDQRENRDGSSQRIPARLLCRRAAGRQIPSRKG